MTSLNDGVDSKKFKEWKESSMERHDLYNFESKIDYTLEATIKQKTSYLLDTYFFIPQSLQINASTYSKEQFFSDMNNRIRFKTPKMSIEGILDENNALSPINTILNKLRLVEYGESKKRTLTTIHREMRLLACIIKASLRDQFTYFLTNYSRLKKQFNIIELIENYILTIERFRQKLNFLREKLLMVQVPLKLKEAFQFANEYMSLQIETWVTRALKKLGKEISPEIQDRSIKIIETEQSLRKNLKSQLVIKGDSDNEGFSYFEGILKKYVQSVLYLEKKKKDPKSHSLEILYSIAAGVAMFFSLFLGFLILQNFVMYSIPFIICMVVIYMLKDRIKDNIRGISKRAIGLVFPDRHIDIVDGFNEEKIGDSKEKVNFLDWKKIPAGIFKIRRASERSEIEEKGKPEVVILYKNEITLFNRKIDRIHTRRRDLSDVIRFNIREFLRYADDPIQYNLNWNQNIRKIESVPISKVYHINVIFKLTSFKGKEINRVYFNKIRIILDQKGIKRVLEPEISL